MKIAILISGEYRTFDICRKSMTFLDNPDYDIYVSTWDKTTYSNSRIGLYEEQYVTKSQIENTLGRPATIEIEEYRGNLGKYNNNMVHRWVRGINLIEKTYDFVFIVRPDIIFKDASSTINVSDGFGVSWWNNDRLHDIFLIVPFEKVREVFSSNLVTQWDTSTDEWHEWWYRYIGNIFKEKYIISGLEHYTFFRCWANQNTTFDGCKRIDDDWRHVKRLEGVDIHGVDGAIKIWGEKAVSVAMRLWELKYFNRYIHK